MPPHPCIRRSADSPTRRLPIPLVTFAFFASLEGISCLYAGAIADRVAVEKVYYSHRLETTAPFEEAVPPSTIEMLVARDRHKEQVLGSVYNVTIADDAVAAEVARIDASTRAPDVLAELKAALGHDPKRFADTVARPIVVERELRARFQNDTALHQPRRAQMEAAREKTLAAKIENNDIAALTKLLESSAPADAACQPVTWQLAPRPRQSGQPAVQPSGPAPETKSFATAGPYAVESTARVAQVLSSPDHEQDRDRDDEAAHYFEDLPARLQQVLAAQLTRPGAVSAVIETPEGFLLYLATAKSGTELTAQVLSLPKISYDEWLEGQGERR